MFKDREDAGRQLALVVAITRPKETVVLGLPRGGVPLAVEVSQYHQTALDIISAKKIGHPLNPEFAIGAVAEGGRPIYKQSEVAQVDNDWLEQRLESIHSEMAKRRKQYDAIIKGKILENQDVIIVDDGIATGQTMFAAIEAVKERNPRSLAVAVPVIASDTYRALIDLVDDVYAVMVTDHFLGSVGAYYQTFPQVSDQLVEALLKEYG